MNTLIIYSSKYGCTKDCADYIKSHLSGPVTLLDINKQPLKAADLNTYDTILLGSSIYIGSVSKKLQEFCKETVDLLCKKKIGIFLCSSNPEQINEYLPKNFPPALLNKASVVKGFGGEARLNHMKSLDRMVMKMATKGNYDSLKVSKEHMNRFIAEINPSD